MLLWTALHACTTDGGSAGAPVEPVPADPEGEEDDVAVDTDLPDEPTGDTATEDTGSAGPEGSPYADCVATRTDSFGSEVIYEYDGLGHLQRWQSDFDGNGIPEDSGSYTYVLDGDRIASLSWVTASGTSGTTVFDAHEHAESGFGFNGIENYTISWANTHDAANKLTRAVSTTSGQPGSVTTDYDACEQWTRYENDVHGDGSLVYVTTVVWTADADCTPSMSVMTSDGWQQTTLYDSEGRTLSEASSSHTADWDWDCH